MRILHFQLTRRLARSPMQFAKGAIRSDISFRAWRAAEALTLLVT